MPRLFTGLEIPAQVITPLCLLQSGLPGARWIDCGNFHVTLRFFGDLEQPVAEELASMLEQISFSPIEVRLSGLDVFGRRKPHSLIALVKKTEEMSRLRDAHDKICRKLDIPVTEQKFTPHVTLARTRGLKPEAVAQYLSLRGNFSAQPFMASRYVLYSSKPLSGGGAYIREATYELEPFP